MGNEIKIDRGPASNGTREPTSMDALTEDLLELVLLRASSPVCLIRAAATCRLWRRVIAGARFRRRVRPLHRPYLLGYYLAKELPGRERQTVFVPAAATPATDPIDARRLFSPSLDFLPRSTDRLWLTDSRGGLLVFADEYTGIVVCDPSTRHYKEVCLPPGDNEVMTWRCYVSTFLLDGDDGDDETNTSPLMSRFRVLYMSVHSNYNDNSITAKVYVFSARDNRWLLMSSTVTSEIVWALNGMYSQNRSPDAAHLYLLGRTADSLFWGVPMVRGNMLTLDERTGEFSVLVLPVQAGANNGARWLDNRRVNLRVITGDALTVLLVRIAGDDLEVLTLVRDGRTCVVDRRLRLSQLAVIEETRSLPWNFLDTAPAAGPGCVVLSPDHKKMWMFSVMTMTLERLSDRTLDVRVFPYELSWPPTIRTLYLQFQSPQNSVHSSMFT